MKKIKRLLIGSINSLWAGLMIAVGAVIYLNCPNKIVGSFLFSIGLIVIMNFGFCLYTGIIGYVRSAKDIAVAIGTMIMNCVGCGFIALAPTSGANELMQAKLSSGLPTAFIKAVICGVLIFVCVACKKDIRITMLAIPAFILSGAEHSIADAAFAIASKAINSKTIIFLLVVAGGNAVGALAISIWLDVRNKLMKGISQE